MLIFGSRNIYSVYIFVTLPLFFSSHDPLGPGFLTVSSLKEPKGKVE